MSVKSLRGQVITPLGWCEQCLLCTTASKVGTRSVSENLRCEKVQADSSTDRQWHIRFYNRLGRWRETNATKGGDQNTREKRKVTDSSMISPSACLSWFVDWEKRPAIFFCNQNTTWIFKGFHFKKQSGCWSKRPPMTQALTLKHLMDV